MNPQSRFPHQRRNRPVIQIVLLSALLMACAVGLASSAAQSPQDNVAAPAAQEREFRDLTLKHVPVKMKLKNEQSFKKLENRNWARELEIEVKNTGSKSIYFMVMNVDMPEMVDERGYALIFQLRYGRKELVNLEIPVQPDDVPILPGESITLKIPERQVQGFETNRHKESVTNPKKIELNLQLINFGDGTGLVGHDGRPIPDPSRKRSQNLPCPKERLDARLPDLVVRAPDLSGKFLKAFASTIPANFLRVNFSPPVDSTTAISPMPDRDLCGCQNRNDCFYGVLNNPSCPCDDNSEFFAHVSTSCSNPFGSCRRSATRRPICQTQFNGQQQCTYEEDVGGCAIGDPDPTPTPTPTPTPSATPRQCTQPRPSLDCACNPDLDAWLCKERS